MNQSNKYKTFYNGVYLKSLTLLVIIVFTLIGLGVPYIFFPFYLGRNFRYEFGDLLSIIAIEILEIFIGSLLIFFILKEPWEIELSNKYIILRDKFKNERKYLCKNIVKIDKVKIETDGIKLWAIIGSKPYKYNRNWNKIPLNIGNKIGQQLKSAFEQLKQSEKHEKKIEI